MPGGNGFYPPVQYSPLWAIIGVVAILLVIGWFVFALVLTRRRPGPVTTADPLPGIPYPVASLRDSYLTVIEDIGRAYGAGAVGFGEAHQRLGVVVREFAAQARGIRAQYMTLEDLRATQLAPLSATVGELYPGAFSGTETGSVAEAVERARRLVIEWR